jgi:hypothetical protein
MAPDQPPETSSRLLKTRSLQGPTPSRRVPGSLRSIRRQTPARAQCQRAYREGLRSRDSWKCPWSLPRGIPFISNARHSQPKREVEVDVDQTGFLRAPAFPVCSTANLTHRAGIVRHQSSHSCRVSWPKSRPNAGSQQSQGDVTTTPTPPSGIRHKRRVSDKVLRRRRSRRGGEQHCRFRVGGWEEDGSNLPPYPGWRSS